MHKIILKQFWVLPVIFQSDSEMPHCLQISQDLFFYILYWLFTTRERFFRVSLIVFLLLHWLSWLDMCRSFRHLQHAQIPSCGFSFQHLGILTQIQVSLEETQSKLSIAKVVLSSSQYENDRNAFENPVWQIIFISFRHDSWNGSRKGFFA